MAGILKGQAGSPITELKTLLSQSDYKTLPDYDKTDEIRTLEGSA